MLKIILFINKKNYISMKKIYFLLLSVVILFAACERGGIPEVMTGDITNVTSVSAKVSGAILDAKGLDLVEAGYCWGLMEKPTYETNGGIAKYCTNERGILDEYVISGLQPGETYYVRAFLKNSENGIGYGAVKYFTAGVGLANVTAAVVSNITTTSVFASGTALAAKSEIISKVGFVLSTSPNVGEGGDTYYANNYNAETGVFSLTINELASDKKYYIRAFAINQAGFAYSLDDTEFTTKTFFAEFEASIVDSYGVEIAKYEVTVGLWNEIMDGVASGEEGLFPKVDVSYSNMMEFINKLNALSLNVYALPTKSEWVMAAGSGTYSGGDNINAVAWYQGNSNNKVHAIGTKAPNGKGVYDMSGNVWEMTSDTQDGNRILVGGGFNSTASQCETNSIFLYAPTSLGDNVGFRLIRK